LGRELTKMHEEVIRGTVSSVLADMPLPRGEFTVVLGGATENTNAPAKSPDLGSLFVAFSQMTESCGLSRREVVRKLAAQYGVSSRELYAALEKAKTPCE
jgi:16S rRNA (cytidine1402-2'-O)-methyltransferase